MSKKKTTKELGNDQKNSTAKKITNQSVHIQLSPDSNRYRQKQKKQQSIEDQLTYKKRVITPKQVQMMLRCCGQYCGHQPVTASNRNSYSITTRIFAYIRNNFKLIGNQKEVDECQVLLNEISSPSTRKCKDCQQLGHSCDNFQFQNIQRVLELDLERLEAELEEKIDQSERYQEILYQRSKYDNAESQLQRLKKIDRRQQQLIRELQKEDSDKRKKKTKDKLRISTFGKQDD